MSTERPCPAPLWSCPLVYIQMARQLTYPDARDDMSNDPPKIIVLLEGQVQDLKSQLEKSEQRETALMEEKKEL